MLGELLPNLLTCTVIAFCSASMSMTVTMTEIFAPLRNAMMKIHHQLGHLFGCFYCMSHWMVLLAMLVYHPVLLQSHFYLIDWIVTAFTVVTLTTFINGILFKVFQSAIRTHVMKHEAQSLLNPHST